MDLRAIVFLLLPLAGCASDVDSAPTGTSQTAGSGGAAHASSGEGAAEATSTGAGGSGGAGAAGGFGGTPSSGGADAGGTGFGGGGDCPDNVTYDEPCHRELEGQFCPAAESCSGLLMCVRGKWTLVHPC